MSDYLDAAISEQSAGVFYNTAGDFLSAAAQAGGDSFENSNGRLCLTFINGGGGPLRVRLAYPRSEEAAPYLEVSVPAGEQRGIFCIPKLRFNAGGVVNVSYPDGVAGLSFLAYRSPVGPRAMTGRNRARHWE